MKRILQTLGLVGLFGAFSVGCGDEPTIRLKTESESALESQQIEKFQRYEVSRVAVFKDSLAYGEKRGIYEIKDNKTRKTYFGVSGIGIIELGDHQLGDTTFKDER